MAKVKVAGNGWLPARLIPVSGIGGTKEREQRAASALLAVISAVDEFGTALTNPYHAPKGKIETYTEVTFKRPDGKNPLRPDGLIRIKRGKKLWTALIEVKTGNTPLDSGQVEDYVDIARENDFDCVITISNEIARIPGKHPVNVDKRKLKKVDLHHLSWSKVLTEAYLQEDHHGVADPDQAWILRELIRYLKHPNSGAADFSDMGGCWVPVRKAVKNGTLGSLDKEARAVASKWEELVSFMALDLAGRTGVKVQEVLPTKESSDVALRIDTIVDSMVSDGVMPGTIRVADRVGDVAIKADLGRRVITASVKIDAPRTGRTTTRINWLKRQLKKTTANDVLIESFAYRSKPLGSARLSEIREDPKCLDHGNDHELFSFEVSLKRPMGLRRSNPKPSAPNPKPSASASRSHPNSFIGSVRHTFDEFHDDVLRHMKKWQPRAPKLQKSKIEMAPRELEEGEAASVGSAKAQPMPK